MTTVRATHRWRGLVAVALFTTAIGIFAKRPIVLLGGVVGLAVVAYPQLTDPPRLDLSIDRRMAEEAPGPDEEVEVSVTVRNDGDRTLPDVRIVDGVPPMLPVADGSARHAAVLRPGASTTFSYSVRTAPGVHRFDPATVIARDVAGATEVEAEVAAETELEVAAAVPEVPLRRRTMPTPGTITTDEGGSGVQFHGIREYRPGDSLRNVDWNRFARTGELATVEFHRERAASVVLLVDARERAYRGREGEPHAVAHAVAAAERIVAAVSGTRHRVGLAGVGREFCWLAPGSGAEHTARAARRLATHPAFSMYPPDGGQVEADAMLAELRARLGRDDQVVLLSPLLDGFPEVAATALEAGGSPVTVLSADVTEGETVGGRLAAVERRNRVTSLRNRGIEVIDWAPEEPLGAVVARARKRGAVVS